MSSGEGLLRNAARALERVNEEGGAASASASASGPGSGPGSASGSDSPADGQRVRPLEDPYLVGEEAAARARRERLARENPGDDVLHREDRRWDWFLGMLLAPRFSGRFQPPPPPFPIPPLSPRRPTHRLQISS